MLNPEEGTELSRNYIIFSHACHLIKYVTVFFSIV